jgi:hypothetical protein
MFLFLLLLVSFLFLNVTPSPVYRTVLPPATDEFVSSLKCLDHGFFKKRVDVATHINSLIRRQNTLLNKICNLFGNSVHFSAQDSVRKNLPQTCTNFNADADAVYGRLLFARDALKPSYWRALQNDLVKIHGRLQNFPQNEQIRSKLTALIQQTETDYTYAAGLADFIMEFGGASLSTLSVPKNHNNVSVARQPGMKINDNWSTMMYCEAYRAQITELKPCT